jgi:hypothetical protein
MVSGEGRLPPRGILFSVSDTPLHPSSDVPRPRSARQIAHLQYGVLLQMRSFPRKGASHLRYSNCVWDCCCDRRIRRMSCARRLWQRSRNSSPCNQI